MRGKKFKEGDRIVIVGEPDDSFPPMAKKGMLGTVINNAPVPQLIGITIVAVDLDGVPRNHGLFGEG